MALAYETAFDCYRAPVLELWGLEPPKNLVEERQLWLQLGHFRRFSDPYIFPEEHRGREKPKEPAAEPPPRRILKRRRSGQ